MLNHEAEQSSSQEATPEQAASLFNIIESLTSTKGNHFGDRNTFGDKLKALPDAVKAQLPEPIPGEFNDEDSFYLTHIIDRKTGVVAIASFDHAQCSEETGVSFASHINYHVITDDGTSYRLERHVTRTEHGPHVVFLDRLERMRPLEQQLAELLELQASEKIRLRNARRNGLLTVGFKEAEQALNLLNQQA